MSGASPLGQSWFVLLALSLCLRGANADGVAPESSNSPPVRVTTPATNAVIQEIRPGVFSVGQVRLDQARRAIMFPAVLNMTEGIVEYLLVAQSGKTHESVLRTEVDPYQIHVALLLLGAHGAGTNAFPAEPGQPIPGDPITIDTSWTVNGKAYRRRAEELVLNRKTVRQLSRGPWVYNGSQVVEGAFIAQLEGSIVSLITDPNALVNNPRPGHEDDELWMVRSKGLPALDTPVTVTFQWLGTNAPSRSRTVSPSVPRATKVPPP